MPLGESMITVLKNNKLLAGRRKNKFEKEEIPFSKNSKIKNFPKATPELLKKIKSKLQRERIILLEKTFLWFTVTALILMITLLFFIKKVAV